MKFSTGTECESDAVFTKEQLLAIRPHHIKCWLQLRAYGKADITADDRPTKQRSGSLKKAKGGISYYHPNKHIPWIDGRNGQPGSGNPTQHPTVAAVIAKVRKHETCGEGAPTRTKQEYTTEEFYKLLEILRSLPSFDHKLKFPLMTLWWYHLIH